MNKARNYLLTSALIVVSTFGMYTNAYAQGKFTSIANPAMQLQEIYAQNVDSVHSLQTNNRAGSAVAVSKDVLVTNCHVLSNGHEVKVDGQSQLLQVINREHKDLDLCFIYVPNMNFKPVSIRASNNVKVGENAYAIGNPQGLNKTLSQGIVSNKFERNNAQWLQTDAAISPGSSGGGLFDDRGNLIGITSAMLNNASNIGFVAPSEQIIQVVAKLKAIDKKALDFKHKQFQEAASIMHKYDDAADAMQELSACVDNNNLYCAIPLTSIYSEIGQHQMALPILARLHDANISFGTIVLMGMHIKGDGVTKDEAKALQYAKNAAMLGDEASVLYVAASYYFQASTNLKERRLLDFQENIIQAYAWLKVAYSIGSAVTKDNHMLNLSKAVEDTVIRTDLLNDANKLSEDICNSIIHCVRY